MFHSVVDLKARYVMLPMRMAGWVAICGPLPLSARLSRPFLFLQQHPSPESQVTTRSPGTDSNYNAPSLPARQPDSFFPLPT